MDNLNQVIIMDTKNMKYTSQKLSKLLAQTELKRCLNYNKKTGVFKWIVKRNKTTKIGDVATTN